MKYQLTDSVVRVPYGLHSSEPATDLPGAISEMAHQQLAAAKAAGFRIVNEDYVLYANMLIGSAYMQTGDVELVCETLSYDEADTREWIRAFVTNLRVAGVWTCNGVLDRRWHGPDGMQTFVNDLLIADGCAVRIRTGRATSKCFDLTNMPLN